tara:strand:+ start:134 stop:1000 length:867 start_codon:yes stop_codon:yes gene_type:complete
MKKNNFGIICFDKKYDTSLYNNYRLALENYFLVKNFIDIKSINDLEKIEYIFIIDEHMTRDIWMKKKFINFVNEKKIKVIVFNFEKIFNSVFKSNLLFQKELEKFENLYQFPSDVDDAEILNKKFIAKQLLSKNSKLKVFSEKNKKQNILFIGSSKKRLMNFKIRNPHYENRDKTLKDIKKIYPNIKTIINKNFPYQGYLEKLASYKYILNPLGTGNFINIRFYEALELGCIPIQQITEKMIPKYKELDFCLPFINPLDINLNNFQFKKYNYYLEDYFEDIDLINLIS